MKTTRVTGTINGNIEADSLMIVFNNGSQKFAVEDNKFDFEVSLSRDMFVRIVVPGIYHEPSVLLIAEKKNVLKITDNQHQGFTIKSKGKAELFNKPLYTFADELLRNGININAANWQDQIFESYEVVNQVSKKYVDQVIKDEDELKGQSARGYCALRAYFVYVERMSNLPILSFDETKEMLPILSRIIYQESDKSLKVFYAYADQLLQYHTALYLDKIGAKYNYKTDKVDDFIYADLVFEYIKDKKVQNLLLDTKHEFDRGLQCNVHADYLEYVNNRLNESNTPVDQHL
jgi:hypothetical protein